nr:pyridoxal-phosphate dependent enzyme [Tenacibaculum maritimum]
MMSKVNLNVKNEQIKSLVLDAKEINLFIKREDKIHPLVSGNKYRKLKYNIAAAKHTHKDTLLTFGGAFSNHIVATAVAGKLSGLKTIGVIRGDELGTNLEKTLNENKTLKEAYDNGMKFYFISRARYREKRSADFLKELKNKFGDFYFIPEGGTNELAVKGCQEILTEEDVKFDYICCAVGTGGTISGIINSVKKHQKVIGFPALKGDFLREEIAVYTKNEQNWSLQTAYHFGGYGKYNDALIQFINKFNKETHILLDPIYTGKMVFGIMDLIEQNQFPKKSNILLIHTGGLQGIHGVNKQLQRKNKEKIII